VKQIIATIALVCALLAEPSDVFATDASGTYVETETGVAVQIQIVETSDGRVTGRYEQVSLGSDGKVTDDDAAITGATDGHTIAITIKPPGLLASGITASGTLDNGVLHLTGSHGLVLNLAKSDGGQFQARVSAIRQQADQNAAERAKQEADQRAAQERGDFINRVRNLTQAIDNFLANVAGAKGLPTAERRYHDITERTREALTREQSIYGEGQAAVTRNQIVVWMNQAQVALNQTHGEVGIAYQNFRYTSDALLREAASVSPSCRVPAPVNVASPTEADQYDIACWNFGSHAKKLRVNVDAIQAAFEHEEQVWQAENREQAALLEAAQRAAQ
jgi:hypothetical protein